MVDSMIPDPIIDGVLTSAHIGDHKDDFTGESCFEGSMTPIPMRSRCYTKACKATDKQSCRIQMNFISFCCL